jgi:hypothetical protein
MPPLAPCTVCARHIRVDEAACPFCGKSIGLLRRRALAALGVTLALATAGCPRSGNKYGAPPPPAPSAEMPPAAGSSSETPATFDEGGLAPNSRAAPLPPPAPSVDPDDVDESDDGG